MGYVYVENVQKQSVCVFVCLCLLRKCWRFTVHDQMCVRFRTFDVNGKRVDASPFYDMCCDCNMIRSSSFHDY